MSADGILGLAYGSLDHAYDISALPASEQGTIGHSSPLRTNIAFCTENGYAEKLSQCQIAPVTPYFKQLAEQGVVANQFALYTHRSSQYWGESSHDSRHLNHGLLVLGKPHLHADLYGDEKAVVKVVHERYYNVRILGLQVGSAPRRIAPELAEKHQQAYCSNGIVDSGASYVVLPQPLFNGVIQDLIAHNAEFSALLALFGQFTGEETGIPLNSLSLQHWPDITFYVEGNNGSETALILSPETYWQVHAPKQNQASFKLTWLPGWPNQIILGLPVINNYYTIFDRAAGSSGCIRFAHKRDPGDTVHTALHTLFHPTQQDQHDANNFN